MKRKDESQEMQPRVRHVNGTTPGTFREFSTIRRTLLSGAIERPKNAELLTLANVEGYGLVSGVATAYSLEAITMGFYREEGSSTVVEALSAPGCVSLEAIPNSLFVAQYARDLGIDVPQLMNTIEPPTSGLDDVKRLLCEEIGRSFLSKRTNVLRFYFLIPDCALRTYFNGGESEVWSTMLLDVETRQALLALFQPSNGKLLFATSTTLGSSVIVPAQTIGANIGLASLGRALFLWAKLWLGKYGLIAALVTGATGVLLALAIVLFLLWIISVILEIVGMYQNAQNRAAMNRLKNKLSKLKKRLERLEGELEKAKDSGKPVTQNQIDEIKEVSNEIGKALKEAGGEVGGDAQDDLEQVKDTLEEEMTDAEKALKSGD